MGTFKWPLRISSMDGQQYRDIEATVDTGAAYTTLPTGLLSELGVVPMGQRRFLLADGRRVYMDYGQAWASVNGDSVITLVIFGEDDGPALLGAYTLEGLALAVDPVEQRLVPTHPHLVLGPSELPRQIPIIPTLRTPRPLRLIANFTTTPTCHRQSPTRYNPRTIASWSAR